MFPTTLKIKIQYPSVQWANSADDFLERLLRRISEKLIELKVSNILLEKNKLTFTVAPFRMVGKGNLLNLCDGGLIEAHVFGPDLTLNCQVSIKRFFTIASVMIIAIGIFLSNWGPKLSFPSTLGVMSFFFIGLVGINATGFLIRFRLFLKRTINEEIQWEKQL